MCLLTSQLFLALQHEIINLIYIELHYATDLLEYAGEEAQHVEHHQSGGETGSE